MAEELKSVSFPIFLRVKKFYWSPNNIVTVGFLASMLVYYLFFDLLTDLQFLGPILIDSIFILGVIYTIYRYIVKGNDHEILKGYLKGELTLNDKSIKIDEQTYSIDTISNISFKLGEIEGNKGISYSKSLNGIVSNGVGNEISILLNTSEMVKAYFKTTKDDDNESFKLLVIEYCKLRKLKFFDLINILGLGYKEVQELKHQYFEGVELKN